MELRGRHGAAPRSLGEFALRDLRIMVMHRLPRAAWLMQILGRYTRRHSLSNRLQLDMDSVALAVGVRSPLLSRQHRRVAVAMSLAHW